MLYQTDLSTYKCIFVLYIYIYIYRQTFVYKCVLGCIKRLALRMHLCGEWNANVRACVDIGSI
jgi:hypothetical protein